MKIGVLSDTHDNLANIRRAVAVFLDRRIRAVLHGGDFCSPFTLAEFKPLADTGIALHAVFGNNDVEGTDRKLLNPGTCSGYPAEKATVAVVDADTMEVEIVVV